MTSRLAEQRCIRRVLHVLAAAAGLACSAEGRSKDEKIISTSEPVMPVVRHDADATIMEHSADAFSRAPQWSVDATPVTTIGGAGGDPQYDLTYASYVIPLSDGRVMTFARVGNKVLVFDQQGKGQRTIGRQGQGPGDWMAFGDPVLLERDTVLVLDFANNRLNWVTADKGVVRSAPYIVSGDMRWTSNISGFLPTGELVMHSAGTWGGHKTDSLQRSLAIVVAVHLTTGEPRTVATLPDLQGAQVETRYRGRVVRDWKPIRLAGNASVTAWDSVIVTAAAASNTIDLRSSDGTVRGQLRLGLPRRAVVNAMRDVQIALELERLDGPRSEGMVDPTESRRLAREAPFADSLPYFEQLIRGSDGTLWVIDAIAPGDTSWTATAFRKDGAIIVRLYVKGDSRPVAFGDGRVIVRTKDENDVVSFKVHRLIPGETRLDTDRPK